MFSRTKRTYTEEFTFHNVSINSEQRNPIHTVAFDLHSTMFLLIRKTAY